MSLPEVVSRDEWLAARKALLAKEKALTRAARRAQHRAPRAADGRDRRRTTCSTGPDGDGEPARPVRGPPPADHLATSCSIPSGRTAARAAPPAPTRSPTGLLEHLHARDTTLRRTSRARRSSKIERYKAKQGWTLPLVLVVRQRLQLRLPRHARRVGQRRSNTTSAPRTSTRHGRGLLRLRAARRAARPQLLPAATATASSTRTRVYARGLETIGGSYYFLDLTALGRQEDWEEPKGRADSAHGAQPDFVDRR